MLIYEIITGFRHLKSGIDWKDPGLDYMYLSSLGKNGLFLLTVSLM